MAFWSEIRAHAEEPAPAAVQTAKADAANDSAPAFTGAALVEALANHNPTPKLFASNRSALFDPNYDWKENTRAYRAIQPLIDNAERAWPEMVSHLEDERYSISWKSFTGSAHNKTIGLICRDIIARNLAAAYYRHLSPVGRKSVYIHFSFPDVVRQGPKALKAWCEARRDKKLYELQIEMCDWAAAELAHGEPVDGVDAKLGKELIAKIEGERESLRNSHVPVLFKRFGPEEIFPYNSEMAEDARKRYESLRHAQ